MHRFLSVLAAIVACLLLLPVAGSATIHHIDINSNSFTPTKTLANVGDTVRWTLVSGFHTTTSDPGSPKNWNSGTLSVPGQPFQIIIFPGDAGSTLPYHCEFHFTMQDTIFVKGSIDTDGDGVADPSDNCPTVSNPFQEDNDMDGRGNACDNCINIVNMDQADADADGQGDACDSDDDGDGVADPSDNCPLVNNPDQLNTDGDQFGNACDSDDDNDGILDPSDNCPLTANLTQVDDDADGVGNHCDNCPVNSNPLQEDSDSDGIGDACESASCCIGTRGNVNCAGIIDLSDLSVLICYLTCAVKPVLCCVDAANVNGTGIVDLSDLSLLIAYLTATPKPTLPPCPAS